MGKGAAGEGWKNCVVLNEVAVVKKGKIKNRNADNWMFPFYVLEGAVRKIAAEKLFIWKIYWIKWGIYFTAYKF